MQANEREYKSLVKSKALIDRLIDLKIEMESKAISELSTTKTKDNEGSVDSSAESQNDYEILTVEGKLDEIRKNVIGFNTKYISPFSIEIQSVYVDHTATSRPYRKIESMINYAKKFSANPHTEFSHFGKYSTHMMHYAHDSLLRSFSACPNNYVALPTGSGSTGAVEKALKIMNNIVNQLNVSPQIFITQYEHHSNILPWVQQYQSAVNQLISDDYGNLIMDEIQKQLFACKSMLIVSVSAASNVTSQLTDLSSLNKVIKNLRKAKKKVIFAVDCAAYCCHHQLNLQLYDEIDFAYLSPHKNLGGAESCGVLIARKNVFNNLKPTFPGGGTVFYVKGYDKSDVMYLQDIFSKQIAGTPPFFGFYRAALSFELLKNDIGYGFIHKRQVQHTLKFNQKIKAINLRFLQQKKNIVIVSYGQSDPEKRANVITLNIVADGNIIHHSFLSLIFADIFGIQLRSGCFCAGPFGIKLLHLNEEAINQLQDELSVGIVRNKPGYLRLDLAFYLQGYEIEYVANAIGKVAEYYKNMELVYTVCNNGQITRHHLFKDTFLGLYPLSKFKLANQKINQDNIDDYQRLISREHKLKAQFDRGVQILKCPIKFLKTKQTCKVNAH